MNIGLHTAMQNTTPESGTHLSSRSEGWLGIEAIARISATSEAEDAPVENVLHADREIGWRASEPGPQTVQITFVEPTNIRRIQLVFREVHLQRTQEFVLRCGTSSGDQSEVVRQQWTFSPQGSTEQLEDYHVILNHVVVLELAITPDISKGGAHASLLRLRIGQE